MIITKGMILRSLFLHDLVVVALSTETKGGTIKAMHLHTKEREGGLMVKMFSVRNSKDQQTVKQIKIK